MHTDSKLMYMKKPILFATISIAMILKSNAQIDQTLFLRQVSFNTGSSSSSAPHTLCSGDIDGDGKVDVVVANSGGNTISIFKNTCTSGHSFDSSSFATKIDLLVLNAPLMPTLCDIDNDGKVDIAVGHYNSNFISIYPGSSSVGSIVFGNRIDIAANANPSYVIFADLDGDGKQDMVVSNFGSNNFSVYRNTSTVGNISFGSALNINTGSGPAYLKALDVNRDGKKDIIITNFNNSSFSVFRNIGSIGFIYFDVIKNFTVNGGPNGLDLCDINNDSLPDIAISSSTSGQISIFQNTSTSNSVNFVVKFIQPTGTGAQELVFADLDRDGIKDLSIVNNGGNTITVYHIKSGLTTIDSNFYDTKTTFNTTGGPTSIAAADMDGNSSNDLIITNSVSGEITVLVNKYHISGAGINEQHSIEENKIIVSPNPFNNNLSVQNIPNENIESVILYDLCGKLLITSKEHIIDTKNLTSGTYFMLIKTDKNLYHQKVIKQD